MTRADMAPRIAEFLAERVLNAPIADLARETSVSGNSAKRWSDVAVEFPEATKDEIRRGGLIAIELIVARSEEIAADAMSVVHRLQTKAAVADAPRSHKSPS